MIWALPTNRINPAMFLCLLLLRPDPKPFLIVFKWRIEHACICSFFLLAVLHFTFLLHTVSTVSTKYSAKLLRPVVQISERIMQKCMFSLEVAEKTKDKQI